MANNTGTSNGDSTSCGNAPHRSTGPCCGQPMHPILASHYKYCWTHGCCCHASAECNNRAPGHKIEATLANRMNGSAWGVKWQGGSSDITDNEQDNWLTSKHSLKPYVYPTSRTSSVIPSSKYYVPLMKADSGATAHYIWQNDASALENVRPTTSGPTVRLLDNSAIDSTLKGQLAFPSLSKDAWTAHVFKDLKSASLLSIG